MLACWCTPSMLVDRGGRQDSTYTTSISGTLHHERITHGRALARVLIDATLTADVDRIRNQAWCAQSGTTRAGAEREADMLRRAFEESSWRMMHPSETAQGGTTAKVPASPGTEPAARTCSGFFTPKRAEALMRRRNPEKQPPVLRHRGVDTTPGCTEKASTWLPASLRGRSNGP